MLSGDTAPRRKVYLYAVPGLDGSKFMLLYRKYLCFKSPHMWISREKQRTQVGWISPSHPGVSIQTQPILAPISPVLLPSQL